MQIIDNNTDQTDLRIIKTARTEQAINEAVDNGYWPLVKPVVPSPDIKVKFAIKQDKATGKIKVVHDYRLADIPIKPVRPELFTNVHPIESDVVVGFTYYYPYHFESPFAAYLVPSDLKVGEVVMLEDLIEDIVADSWNQGDTYRLASCKAIWDGKDFILQQDPNRVGTVTVG